MIIFALWNMKSNIFRLKLFAGQRCLLHFSYKYLRLLHEIEKNNMTVSFATNPFTCFGLSALSWCKILFLSCIHWKIQKMKINNVNRTNMLNTNVLVKKKYLIYFLGFYRFCIILLFLSCMFCNCSSFHLCLISKWWMFLYLGLYIRFKCF